MDGVCGTLAGYLRHHQLGQRPCPECLMATIDSGTDRVTEDSRSVATHHGRKSECGTIRGYRRHIRRGETPCPACQYASDSQPVKRRARAECGTLSGYERHRKRSEESCAPCREAHNAYRRERYGISDIRCGTRRGYAQHLNDGETPCPACQLARDAYNEQTRNRRLRKSGRGSEAVEMAECGTITGAYRHYTRGEEPCETCRLRMSEPRYSLRRVSDSPSLRPECGTAAGYRTHTRRGESVCEPCHTAYLEYRRRLRTRRRRTSSANE